MLVDRRPVEPSDHGPVAVLPALDPASYARHGLHAPERAWPETNCSVDLMVEVLAARGFEPLAALGFTVTQDFEGDHFTFFKIPATDLLQLYGVELIELAVFDDLEAHLVEQVRRGRLPLVELDAFHLPDTRGVSYGISHSKTTVGVNQIDPAARRLRYFHNAGYFELAGEDYEALFHAYRPGALPLLPYSEIVKFDRAPPARDLLDTARRLMRGHLGRRPAENPFEAWRRVLPRDAAALAVRPEAWFHTYAFNVLRQAGANFGCLAAHLQWMATSGEAGLDAAHAAADAIAQGAKVLQFQLARAAARRRVADADADVARLAARYDTLMDALSRHFGAPDAVAA